MASASLNTLRLYLWVFLMARPQGSFYRVFSKNNYTAVERHEIQDDMLHAINTNKTVPVIDRSFGLTQLADAFRYQTTGNHFGKIVIEY